MVKYMKKKINPLIIGLAIILLIISLFGAYIIISIDKHGKEEWARWREENQYMENYAKEHDEEFIDISRQLNSCLERIAEANSLSTNDIVLRISLYNEDINASCTIKNTGKEITIQNEIIELIRSIKYVDNNRSITVVYNKIIYTDGNDSIMCTNDVQNGWECVGHAGMPHGWV